MNKSSLLTQLILFVGLYLKFRPSNTFSLPFCVCLQTQMHSLTPFGSDLFSKDMVEDNMTWNFVAGLTVAREILESYGCVVRVISPRTPEAALGSGGTRIELWLPSFASVSHPDNPAREVQQE